MWILQPRRLEMKNIIKRQIYWIPAKNNPSLTESRPLPAKRQNKLTIHLAQSNLNYME